MGVPGAGAFAGEGFERSEDALDDDGAVPVGPSPRPVEVPGGNAGGQVQADVGPAW